MRVNNDKTLSVQTGYYGLVIVLITRQRELKENIKTYQNFVVIIIFQEIHRGHISLIEVKNMIKYNSVKILFLSEVVRHTCIFKKPTVNMSLTPSLSIDLGNFLNFPLSVSLSVK